MEFPYTCGVERHEAPQAPARVLAHWSNFDTHTLIIETCRGSLSLCVTIRGQFPHCATPQNRENAGVRRPFAVCIVRAMLSCIDSDPLQVFLGLAMSEQEANAG